jgi:hypothetical protein
MHQFGWQVLSPKRLMLSLNRDPNSQTQVLLDHKAEAIRKINLEMRQGVSNALILAVCMPTMDARETEIQKNERIRIDSSAPFKRPPMPRDRQELFTGIT